MADNTSIIEHGAYMLKRMFRKCVMKQQKANSAVLITTASKGTRNVISKHDEAIHKMKS